MRLFIDLDTQSLVSGLGTRTPITAITFKRGDSARIEVQFFRGVTPKQLAAGATGKFALKPSGKYDAAAVVADTEWTLEGADATAIYVFAPSFNTVALNALLAHDENDANDVASVTLMAEIEWLTDGLVSSTQTVNAIVSNDVIKDTDGTPLEDDSPLDWLAANSIVFDPAITGLTGGGPSKLDGIAVTAADAGRVQLVLVAGLAHIYVLTAADLAEYAPYYVNVDSDPHALYWRLQGVQAAVLSAFSLQSNNGLVLGSATIPGELYIEDGNGNRVIFYTADLTSPLRQVIVPDREGILAIGIPEYATLDAANAAIGDIGAVFYNLATSRYEVTNDVP